jgi:hypothetical protein
MSSWGLKYRESVQNKVPVFEHCSVKRGGRVLAEVKLHAMTTVSPGG